MAQKKRTLFSRVIRYGLLLFTGLVLLTASLVILTWPDVAALSKGKPETTAFIEQARARGTDAKSKPP